MPTQNSTQACAVQAAPRCCFFRTNTSDGCISHLPGLCPPEEGWRVIYLKSGHGGAATRLMEAAARISKQKQEYMTELYVNHSAATEIWDAPGKERRCALRLPKQKLCLIDAEAPYALHARLPGAGEELLSLDCCRNNALLREQRAELEQLHGAWHRELLRAGRFLRAAKSMKRDMSLVASETLEIAKIERYASRFAAKRYPAPNGHIGRESRRFLTAVTGQGLLLRRSGLESGYAEAIVLEDEYGVAAPILWDLLRAYALGNGIDIVSCPCLLFPGGEPEHILLPQLGLACVTANRRHPIDLSGAQHIQAGRFFQKEALREHRCRLNFCRRTMRELLAEAYQAQAAAEQAQAQLDAVYLQAELPDAVEALAEKIVK